MSVIYKEREREREWDTSSRSGAQGYTTVRRYKIPDHSLEQDTYESEMRLVHRGGRSDRSDFDDRRSTKDYVVERDERDVREYRYHDRSPSPRGRDIREYRDVRVQREIERSPSPSTHRDVREIRIARDYEREAPREDQYSLEKYSRDIEYYREPQQPQQPQQHHHPQHIYIRNEAPAPQQAMQPIIIREEAPQPIIIREREPAYEHIERTEIQEERQVARPAPRHDEDYYYERRVKEVDRGGRHESRYFDEREYGRDRYGDKNYYSDDDVIYVHKEKDTWGSETNTKRDVAAGALAGIAAGQIVRHHRKRKGDAPGGSVGNALGYGTLGAVSAVALDKFNNRDRSRSMSSERGRRRRHSHGRARSKSRVREIGALAAIAGVGALAYAAGRKNKEKPVTTVVEEHRHRSRSRKSRSRRGHSRRGRSRSVTVVETEGVPRSRSRSTSKHMDPKHRNNRTAQVGLASAAVAGLVQRHRSKSRKREGKRSRSHSRVRDGVPIAAAGVTGAAVAGLYEKHKAKKEARSLSRSKSRSRSRSVLDRLTGRSRSRRGSTASEPVLVEYGGDPIYIDPATRSHRGRRRRGSSSSSDGRRHGSRSRSRSKSRARSVAETAAVAGVAGLAAHEAAKRRDRKKAEKERDKRREEDSAYSTGSYSPYDSPRPSTAHPNDSRFFPETNYFPPPPVAAAPAAVPVNNNPPYPPYNPADYHPQQSSYEPGHPSGYVNAAPHDDLNPGNPYARPTQQQDAYYGQPRRPDDNVSAPAPPASGNEHLSASARGGSRPQPAHMVSTSPTNLPPDGITTSTTTSTSLSKEPESPSPLHSREKQVQFDLNPRGPSRDVSPEKTNIESESGSSTENEHSHTPRHHDPRRSRRRKDDERSDSTRESGRRRKRHHGERDEGDESDATIDLPPRFDEHGRRREVDPVADKLESVLQSLFR